MGYLTISGRDDDAVFVGEYTRLGDDAKKEQLKQARESTAAGGGDDGIPTSLLVMGGAAIGLVGMVLYNMHKARKNPGRRRGKRYPVWITGVGWRHILSTSPSQARKKAAGMRRHGWISASDWHAKSK